MMHQGRKVAQYLTCHGDESTCASRTSFQDRSLNTQFGHCTHLGELPSSASTIRRDGWSSIGGLYESMRYEVDLGRAQRPVVWDQ
jgi:hypothetical protein